MPKRRIDVEKIREILRLYLELNYSLRETGIALGVSKTTVGEYQTIYTSRVVEVFKDNVRIAIHQRDRRPYWYTTIKQHMPQDHQLVDGWNPHRLLSWAEKKGGSVKEFIQLMLDQRAHPQQAFKACLGVLNLGKKYDDGAMQIVCKNAIEINSISYRFIANSLKNKTYKIEDEDPGDMKLPFHENIRGKENYK